MELFIDRQIATDSSTAPSVEQMRGWVSKALEKAEFKQASAELTIRVVNEAESQQLNNQYRQKNKPTNVLSFPFEVPAGVPCNLLGDLVVCESVVLIEASEQSKKPEHHWAHMIVHGTLHLLGFDHIDPDDAEKMEALEILALSEFGINNPYS